MLRLEKAGDTQLSFAGLLREPTARPPPNHALNGDRGRAMLLRSPAMS